MTIKHLLVSVFTALPASAAKEIRVDVGTDGKYGYVTVSNVVEEKPSIPLYIANAPAVVTFHVGRALSLERIEYFATAVIEGTDIHVDGPEGAVKFDVKKYTNPGEEAVQDENVKEADFMPLYVDGNYATLTKPGYYVVAAAPEAMAPVVFAVQVLGAEEAEAEPAAPETISAMPTASKVMVNGKDVAFEAYTINGSNFFKLRDLAAVVSGSPKQFEVTWDGEKNAINLVTGKAYTLVGNELAVSANPQTRTATPTTAKLYVNGQEVQFTAYQIGGNNYFKLRDVAQAIDFGVTWDAATSTIGIDTGIGYTQ